MTRLATKNKALELRHLGRSYNAIAKELGVSKGTVSAWLKDLVWSKKIKDQLVAANNFQSKERARKIGKINQVRWLKLREDKRAQAQDEFPKSKNHPLFVPALMLYWAEGDSNLKEGNVRLTNTDPRMVKLFIAFAMNFLLVPIEDIKMGLILYPDLDQVGCINYWSEYTGIPMANFYKVQYIKGSHPTKRLENGICSVRIVGGVGLKEKIYCWIELIYQDLVRE